MAKNNNDLWKFLGFTILFLVLFLLINLSWVSIYARSYPLTLGPLFNNDIRTDHLKFLNNYRPGVVFIGDSTLAHSVDMNAVSVLLKATVYSYHNYGSTSAVWYLILKNSILKAVYPPPNVVICFQDTILTAPDFHVSGDFQYQIDQFAGLNEDLVVQLSYVNNLSWFENKVSRYVPIYGDRLLIKRRLENYFKINILESVINKSGEDVLNDSDVVFNANNKIPEIYKEYIKAYIKDLYSDKNLNFSQQLQKSYLPEMIRLAKENGVNLIFVRLPNRVDYISTKKKLNLQDYMTQLLAYLAEEQVSSIDMASGFSWPEQYFSDAIHMTQEGQDSFTPLFAQSIEDFLK